MKNNIKLLIMDVDGTLTDGKINLCANGEIFKSFNVKDGYGILKILCENNIVPIIITGRESDIVINRCKELQIKYIFQNIQDKKDMLLKILDILNCALDEVAYIGDDDNDYEAMRLCKYRGCPQDSSLKIKAIATYTCKNKGGDGAVREFIDYLINIKNL